MRHLALGVFVAAAGFVGISSAGAMSLPSVQTASSNIVVVRDGCGPYGHRDYYGRCVGYGRPVYRACPPGFHWGVNSGRCWPNR